MMAGSQGGVIRDATVDDIPELNALTGRSVLSWGYDPDILEWGRGDLEITPAVFDASTIRVLEGDDRILGYYALRRHEPDMILERMFVDADRIGTGCGRRLWRHAVEAARERDLTSFFIPADANAAPFYKAMGATFIESIDSGRSDFALELLRFDLAGEERP